MATVAPPRIRELTAETARHLAESSNGAPVLSVYLDLDPTEFATPPARSSAIRSLVDDASRQIESAGLGHDDHVALKADLEKVRRLLEGPGLPSDGARAVAVFCSSGSGLFDVVKLPRSTQSRAVVGPSPWVEPLVDAAPQAEWCVLLVNRSVGRILRGGSQRMDEVSRIDSDVHGKHDQGGWSQKNYERSVDREAAWHLDATLQELFARFQRRPFDHLLLGAPEETAGDVTSRLHPYVKERLAGRIEIDVENTSPADVARLARPFIEDWERGREREDLERLREGLARGGRAAGGFEETLAALNERRVGTLLMVEGFAAAGVVCPACGWLGPEAARACPADGTQAEPAGDLSGRMIERALEQSAAVRIVRHHPDLGPMGGVGAVTRF